MPKRSQLPVFGPITRQKTGRRHLKAEILRNTSELPVYSRQHDAHGPVVRKQLNHQEPAICEETEEKRTKVYFGVKGFVTQPTS